MNRREFATKIQDLINRAYLADIPKSYYEGLFDEAEKLCQPITLTEFLGWEENVEYEVEDKIYIMKYLDLPKHYKLKGKLCNDSLELSWKGGNLETRELHLIIDELKQATKVKKKLKAYHVKDEYSYNELMKELEEQGYEWRFGAKPTKSDIWRGYKNGVIIYCKEDKTITHSWLTYYENCKKDKYDLIEYYKEEPKFYAKIKGWEKVFGDNYYWNISDYKNCVFVSDKYNVAEYNTQMTKTEWNKLGINDTNADWEEVGE